MAMFGSLGRFFGNGADGGNSGQPGMFAPIASNTMPAQMGGFQMPQSGADEYLQANPVPAAPAPAPLGGFQPHHLGLGDKIGLLGDIWAGNSVTQKRLDGDFDGDVKTYELNAPKPQLVPGVGLVQRDPTTGLNKVLVPEPAKVPSIAENASYLDQQHAGLGQQYLNNFASNGGGQGPGMITVNGQQMMRSPDTGSGAPPEPPAEAVAILRSDPTKAQFFDHTFGPGMSAKYLNGGAVPTTGPGGFPRWFPLYPTSH